MYPCSRRRLDRRRRYARGAVFRDDDGTDTGAFRRAHQRAQVARIGDPVHQHDGIGLLGKNLLEWRVLILAHQGGDSLVARRLSCQPFQPGFIGELDAAAAGSDQIYLGGEAPLVTRFHVEHSNRRWRRGDQLSDWLDAVNYFAVVAAGATRLVFASVGALVVTWWRCRRSRLER